jgi:phosphoribosylanthranilate isomerase
MPTRIKISGLTSAEDARLAGSIGVDLAAFVYWPRSSRYVTLETTWALHRALPSHVETVGIFVDAPLPLVQHVVHRCALDHAQLFGVEPRSEVEALVPHAFKAVNLDRPDALDGLLRSYLGLRPSRQAAPSMLLNLVGHMAEAWADVASACAKTSLIIASPALDAITVGNLIATARPWGIDLWSAVESSPGRLDPDRLAELVDAARRADADFSPTDSDRSASIRTGSEDR